ncbi:serine/arginine-rich splicing factor 11-like isoform X1 [Archocentrus centrarchus]|uniref:serine/arginine-rich splicing factor 11-like isoform X1 n=2 Tax=Archocentrus centrarchus TaxID=63155 RepID=UPI0011E9B91D|nr:serine/arginine-rich splicing factor 11-like isoform X1 [Archocentrus centrarchus]
MNYTTKVVQVTNVSPSTTSEQMRTLFGFLGTIEELKLFPPDDSPMPVTSRVCFVKFQEPESVGVSQHLTNTVFVDRALIVVPFAEGSIPDEAKALSLLAPANAVAGILPGGGLLPMPNPIPNPPLANPFGAPNMDPMAAFGFPGAGMNPQAADQLLKFMTDPKLNPLAAGLSLNPGLKADAANKEIEEAMKRVREAQSLISAAIEPGHKEGKKKHSRSRSRSRRRRSRSRSRHRRTRSKSRRRSNSRSRRRSKSPRRRHTDSRDRSRRSRSRSRERKKDDAGRRKSKTPPKSYSTARRSRSVSRRRRKSRSSSRSPKKSPKRRITPSPSPRRHKKEKKRDKDRERERERDRRSDKERSREERERSSSKKKKSKDKERERDRKSDGEKDVKITRDYDEEEQGYDSEKEREDRKDSDDSALSPQSVEGNGRVRIVKQAKVNGADDHHEEDMDVSD